MNAQQLVELRKQGSISQEEFFVGLNSLRRQNSESLQQRSSSRVDPVVAEDARKPVTDGDNDEEGRGGSSCRPEVDPTAVGPGLESVVATTVEQLSLSASVATPSSDITTSNREVHVAAVGSAPSASEEPAVPAGAQQELEGGCAAVGFDTPLPVSPGSKPQHPLPDITDVVGNGRTQPRARPHGVIDRDNEELSAGQAKESDCESGWLISPSGEKTRQSTSTRRKGPESQQRRHPYRRATSQDDDDQFRGTRSTPANAGLSPGGGGVNRDTAATVVPQARQETRVWRPAGGALFRSQQQWLSRSQPATPSHRHSGNTHNNNNNNTAEGVRGRDRPGPRLSPTRGGNDGNSGAVGTTGTVSPKPHWRPAGAASAPQPPCCGGSSTPLSSSRPVGPFGSCSDGVGDGVGAHEIDESGGDGGGKRRSTVTASPRSSRSVAGELQQQPALTSSDCDGSGGGGDRSRGSGNGTKSPSGGALPESTGGLWRSRDRHRGPQQRLSPAQRRESRRRSSNTVASVDSGRYYTAAVRCDRYGYPVHDREGEGGGGGGAAGGGGHVFAPMIKGLPDFYESRPKRIGHRSDGSPRMVGEGQSLYERTTDWQAKASEIR